MTRSVLSALLVASAAYGSPAIAQTDNDGDTASIVVTGARPRSEASAGTKGSAPLAETPQSISVISSAEIADLGPRQP